MAHIAYVNGRFLRHDAAAVHIEDRGYQFADGIYEVVAVRRGRPANRDRHLDRMERSLAALRIAPPLSRRALELVIGELVRRNRLTDGMIYLQVTRGTAPRDHPFPPAARPALVMTARRGRPPDPVLVEEGVRVIAIPDIRWGRCDVKSIALLPNVLGKQEARDGGAFEAWQVDREGRVTEGTSTNAWIVTPAGEIVTHPADHAILGGVTRAVLLDLARRAGLPVAERPFTLAEAKAAREAFLTSTTALLLPVVAIDEAVIGNGKPGSIAGSLRRLYLAELAAAGRP